MQLIPFKEIDLIQYDGCVNNAHNKTIFGRSWFLKAVIGEFDVIIEGNYASVMPLPYYNLRLGGKAIVHHPLTSRLGIYSKEYLSQEKIRDFVDFIPSIYKNVQLFFNHGNPIGVDIPPFKRMQHRIFTLKLNRSYDKLRKNYSDEIRNLLDRIEEDQGFIEADIGIEEVVKAFSKFTRIKSWGSVLKQLLTEAHQRGVLKAINLLDKDGQLVCVGAFLVEEEAITQLILASANADPAPQIFALDSIIRGFSGSPLEFDMNTIQATLAENFAAKPKEFYSLTHLRKQEKWLHSLGLNIYKGR